jgi:ribose-phosphate pyrophosphokinase
MSLTVPAKKVLLTGRVMESPNDFVMNMMFAIDACKRQGIEVVDLFIPCLPYARQDRLNGRSVSITSKVMLNMFENIGVNKIYVMDLHSTQMEGFTNISLENIDSMPILIDSVKNRMRRLGGEFVIVSPDAGGVKRAKKYADSLGLPIAIIHKSRDPYTNESTSFSVVGNVENCHVVVVDDMVDTGGTLVDAERMLKEEGAITVAFSIGHPVLSKPRNELRELDLTVLNTVPWTPDDFVIKQVENYFLQNVLGVLL